MRIKTLFWACKLAFRINKKTLIYWLSVTVLLSVLPAIALALNKEILHIISIYLTGGSGSFTNVLPYLISLAAILFLSGFSSRINDGFLYMELFDTYYLGMQELLMNHVNNVSIQQLYRKDVKDEYFAIMNRAGSLTDFVSAACLFISRLVGVGALLIVAFTISQFVFFISLGYICFALIFNAVFIERTYQEDQASREAERRVAHYKSMVLQPGIAKEVRIFNSSNEIFKSWSKQHDIIDKVQKKRIFRTEFQSFISGIAFYAFMFTLMLKGLFQIKSGLMIPSVFITIYIMCQSMSSAISGFVKCFLIATHGLVALERQYRFINELTQADASTGGQKQPSATNADMAIECKNINFSYNSDEKPILRNINLCIKKGEKIALIGLNGSGKTSLVKIIMGLLAPTSGEILLNNVNYDNYDKRTIMEQFGVFFQNYYIFHASMRENIGFGGLEKMDDEDAINAAVEKGGAKKIVEKLPKGLDHWLLKSVDKTGSELSGGEKQKVAVSRTHMNNKDILIFDEPASALDPISEIEQFENIRTKIDNKTAILISHRVGFAPLVDRIVLLENGMIIEEGTHKDLMQKRGQYYNLYTAQTEMYTNKASNH